MSEEFRVLLAQPLWPREKQWGRFSKGAGNNTFPYGMACVAAAAEEAGFTVEALDCQLENYSEQDLAGFLKANPFQVVGMPCYGASAAQVFNTARVIKAASPETKVVLGGIHPTTVPELTLTQCPECDAAVMGEGEATFARLLSHYRDGQGSMAGIKGLAYRDQGRIRINDRCRPLADLDGWPLPAYHLFPMERYVFAANSVKRYPTFGLTVARGCPFRCTFCDASGVHGKRLRHRSVDRVVEEIRLLKTNYGAQGIVFQDSTFSANREWTLDLCRAIREAELGIVWSCGSRVDRVDPELLKEMKRSGCWKIFYGLESGNQKSLDLIRKGVTVDQNRQAVAWAREAGLFIEATYIIGLPGETEEDVLRTIDFAKEMATQAALFFLPIPFPETELWRQCEADGGLRADAGWDDYSTLDFSNPVYVNPLLGKEKMTELWQYSINSYYTRPKVIWRNLATIRSYHDIRKYWYGFRAFCGI